MIKNWDEKIADENYKIYTDYRDYRQIWYIDAIKHNNFRRGFHFSKKEEEEILARRQAPIPINITTAICETAEALLTASDPIIAVTPANFHDELNRQSALAVAQKYEAALKSCWYNSLGSLQYDRIIQDYNNVGRGLAYTIPKFIKGEFTVDMKYLSFRDFYPDPNSRDPHYTDSDNMIVSYTMSELATYKYAKMYDPSLDWKSFKKEFNFTKYIDSPYAEDRDKYLSRSWANLNVSRLIVRYALEESTLYSVKPIQQAQSPEMLQMSIQAYMQYQDKKFETIPPDVQKLVQQGLLEVIPDTDFYLAEYVSFGGYGLKNIYPIDAYNIIPFVYDHNDHPYPLGRVHYIAPLQRALNKCIMITILNASLSNNTKYIYEEKSIIDLEQWQSNSSISGAMLPWRRLSENTQPPMSIPPNPLTDAFLQFPVYIQRMMEYVSGILNVMMGVSDDKTPDVFRTVASLQSAGGERVKRRIRNLDSSLSQTGRVIAKFYKEFAPYNGSITWIEGLNKIKSIEYNQLQPDPKDPTKLMVMPDSDLKIGFRDLRFISTANQGYENANTAQILTLLATQLGVQDAVPAILKKLNIPEAEEIIQNMDVRKQSEQMIQQLQQKIAELEKESQGQAKQLSAQIQATQVADTKTKLTRFLESTKTKYKDDIKTRAQIDQMLNSLNNSIEGQMNGQPNIPSPTGQPGNSGGSAGFGQPQTGAGEQTIGIQGNPGA